MLPSAQVTAEQTSKAQKRSTAPPLIACSELRGTTLRWEVTSYSPYFARFNAYPGLVSHPTLDKLLFMSIGSSLPYIMLALRVIVFTFLVRSNNAFAFGFLGSCICWSVFSLCMNGGAGIINLPMLYTHKIADSALWIAILTQFRCFEINGWLNKPLQTLLSTSVFIGLVFILFGATSDTIQLGTSIPFPILIIATMFALYRASQSRQGKALSGLAKQINLITISVFLFTLIHDILLTLGAFDGMLVSPYGVAVTMFLLATNANKQLKEAHL